MCWCLRTCLKSASSPKNSEKSNILVWILYFFWISFWYRYIFNLLTEIRLSGVNCGWSQKFVSALYSLLFDWNDFYNAAFELLDSSESFIHLLISQTRELGTIDTLATLESSPSLRNFYVNNYSTLDSLKFDWNECKYAAFELLAAPGGNLVGPGLRERFSWKALPSHLSYECI